MGIGVVEMLVFLGVGALAFLAVRKSSWKSLVAVPLAMLVLLGSLTIVWSVVAPRQVYYPPYDFVVPAIETSRYDPVYQTFNANVLPGRAALNPSHVQHASVPTLSVIGLGGLFVIGVLAAAAVAGRRVIAGNDKLVVALLAVVGAFAVLLTVGLLLFVGGTWVSYAPMRQMTATELRPPPPPPVAVAVTDVATIDPTADAAEPEAAVSEAAVTPPADLPEWARTDAVSNRDLREWAPRNPAVLVSDEWSSVPESEVQLEAMAAHALRQQLQLDHGPSFDWRPSNDFIHQSGVIQRRFTRQTTLKVGEFEPPMYQTYWEVSATPQVSHLAEVAWRGELAERRLKFLGGGVAGLTLLFASIAGVLRFDAATGGRHRRRVAAATVAGVAAIAGTAMLFVA